jgi:hypothetical protein
MSKLLLNRISDHFPIIFSLETNKMQAKKSFFQSRNYSESSILKFKEALNRITWNALYQEADAQRAYSMFHEDFCSLFNLYFPLTMSKFNCNIHKKEKWMTKGLLVSRMQKIKLCKQSVKVPSEVNIEKFKKFRNLYNIILRKSKKLYYDQQFELSKQNLKKTWALLFEVIKKNKHKNTSIE